MARELPDTPRARDGAVVRLAATGDLHVGKDSVGQIRPGLEGVAEAADLLLIAGDLTQHGDPEEGRILSRELTGLGLPMIAVLGNHDYHHGCEEELRQLIEGAGVTLLEGNSRVLNVRGYTVGIAGAKGFGGGFAGACGTEFGEPEMKTFIRHTKGTAMLLRRALAELKCDIRIALTHYAPIKETLMGERLEIYPFLGSYLLGEAIDHVGCDLAVHGHAHHGTERGVSAAGIQVRNVARPVIRLAYKVYALSPHRLAIAEVSAVASR